MKTDVNHTLEIRGCGDYALWVDTGRNRRNREALLDAGRSIGHAFSVRELHETARRDQPRIGLTTAYRAIERWRDEGLVEEAGTRSGEAVIRDVRHQRPPPPPRVRRSCGAISTLEGCALVSLRQAAEAVGFELSDRALHPCPGAAPAARTVSGLRDQARAAASPVFGIRLGARNRRPGRERAATPVTPLADSTPRFGCCTIAFATPPGRGSPEGPHMSGIAVGSQPDPLTRSIRTSPPDERGPPAASRWTPPTAPLSPPERLGMSRGRVLLDLSCIGFGVCMKLVTD